MGDVTLGDIMAQLQRMDARPDTFSIELYQVNIHVGCIARQQATMGEHSCTLGFVTVFTHTLYLFFFICGCMFLSPTSTCVVSFLSLYTCFLLIVCNLLFLFHTKMPG